ncbi:hypothetical protein L4X63_00285 [Geomonas sp. Red32]|uniref:hypothetical protein n=1 Tax=Geomonas sp. Red32 TaxID=2912856 RepID=UPI00202CF030|nr:hypothetical protein [Geomonas sp. Red32]MCM0080019.1 hypothetical protein [Geomonas sp. Red32]
MLIDQPLAVENDLSAGIRRIFDDRPDLILFQGTVGGIPCDKAARQVKMLLGGSPARLVLLSDDGSRPLGDTFEEVIDLRVSFDDLVLKLREMAAEPGNEPAAAAEEPPSSDLADEVEITLPEDKIEEFWTYTTTAASEEVNNWDFAAEAGVSPQPVPDQSEIAPSGPPPGEELGMRMTTDEFGLPIYDLPTGSSSDDWEDLPLPVVDPLPAELFPPAAAAPAIPPSPPPPIEEDHWTTPVPGEEPSAAEAAEPEAAAEPPVPSDLLAEELLPDMEELPPKLRYSPPIIPTYDRVERERADRLFGNISEEGNDQPPLPEEEPRRSQGNGSGQRDPKPASRGKVTTPAEQHAQGVRKPAAPTAPDKIDDSLFQAPPDEFDAGSLKIDQSASGRRTAVSSATVALAGAVVVCLVLAAAYLWPRLHIGKSGGPGHPAPDQPAMTQPRPAATAPAPAAPPGLPAFIPKEAADARYGATHPGWERYQADGLEYLVFREQGAIRAIQIVAKEQGTITVPLVKTWARIATGLELPAASNVRLQGGFEVGGGLLANGTEFAIYRSVPEGDIRGFVLSLPAAAPAPAAGQNPPR